MTKMRGRVSRLISMHSVRWNTLFIAYVVEKFTEGWDTDQIAKHCWQREAVVTKALRIGRDCPAPFIGNGNVTQ
jgi:hypothetical protein